MKALDIAAQTGIPVLLWGAPGTGKTAYINSLGAALDLPVVVVIASIREPSDFAGLPVIHDGSVIFAPPRWAKMLLEFGKGILFLDELSTAPPAVQAALLRVVMERTVGDLELPAGVQIIAAANPPEQAAAGWDLAPPLANRFLHLHWKPSVDEWVEGMLSDWPVPKVVRLPADWKSLVPMARSLIASFIRHRPDLLHKMPTDLSLAGRAWPSRRTWDMAAYPWAACEAVKAPMDTRSELMAGAVGEGAAAEFLYWVDKLDLPDPEELLSNPQKYQHPDRGDKVYAVLTSVTSAVISKPSANRWRAAWMIVSKVCEGGNPDIAAVAARSLLRIRKPNWQIPDSITALADVLKAAELL